jgi:hypothetical protein
VRALIGAFAALRQLSAAARLRLGGAGERRTRLDWQQRQRRLRAVALPPAEPARSLPPRLAPFEAARQAAFFQVESFGQTDAVLAARAGHFVSLALPPDAADGARVAAVRAKLERRSLAAPLSALDARAAADAAGVRARGARAVVIGEDGGGYGRPHREREPAFALNFARRRAYVSSVQAALAALPAPDAQPLRPDFAAFAPALLPGPEPEIALEVRAAALLEVRARHAPAFFAPALADSETEALAAAVAQKLPDGPARGPALPPLAEDPPPLSNPFVLLAPANFAERNGLSGRPNRTFVAFYEKLVNSRCFQSRVLDDFGAAKLEEPRHVPGLRFSVDPDGAVAPRLEPLPAAPEWEAPPPRPIPEPPSIPDSHPPPRQTQATAAPSLSLPQSLTPPASLSPSPQLGAPASLLPPPVGAPQLLTPPASLSPPQSLAPPASLASPLLAPLAPRAPAAGIAGAPRPQSLLSSPRPPASMSRETPAPAIPQVLLRRSSVPERPPEAAPATLSLGGVQSAPSAVTLELPPPLSGSSSEAGTASEQKEGSAQPGEEDNHESEEDEEEAAPEPAAGQVLPEKVLERLNATHQRLRKGMETGPRYTEVFTLAQPNWAEEPPRLDDLKEESAAFSFSAIYQRFKASPN